MPVNVGSIDRILRVIAGLGLIAFALGFIAPGSPYAVYGWIGIVPILTAALGFCPAYTLLGINTCAVKSR